MSAQPEDVTPPTETKANPGLKTAIEIINKSPQWGVLWVDPIRETNHYVFYLRSKQTYRFRNVLDEYAVSAYDSWQKIEGDLITNHPHTCAERMMEFARRELKVARDCI
jgi:hypothetical protein